ncbi:DMT family transporter [Gandjariella thermophila]|uniref:QacE family quaternary ammonium compound efflux SMR transporter n=1 Tax=Gandjariella thermophila TaxID=1931992 RepID=A0A4D4J4J9_9PSEU|nr:multidrug efflux SMR transporter [Gandjariella thermophila]GDY28897.1 QacE family quaternary ammonium compound efflux SMR transporter [Gandjariella thermophila]
MAVVLLLGAIVAEVVGTLSLRASSGFSRLWPSVVTVVGYAVAFVLLARTLRTLNVGPVYAIWSGLGTTGAFIGGAILYGEPVRPLTVIGAVLVVGGVALIYLGGGTTH